MNKHGCQPKNRGVSPQSIHFNRVFHYFHHPFWGTPIFGNIHTAMENPPFVDVLSIFPIGNWKSWISIAMFVHRRVSDVQITRIIECCTNQGYHLSPPTKLLNEKPSQKPANSSPSIVHLHLISPNHHPPKLIPNTHNPKPLFFVPQPFPIPFPHTFFHPKRFDRFQTSQTLPWVWEGLTNLLLFLALQLSHLGTVSSLVVLRVSTVERWPTKFC